MSILMTMGRGILGLMTAVWLIAGVSDAEVTLAWDPSPDTNVSGYVVYQGLQSGRYTSSNALPGLVTNAVISGLETGVVYFFAVTAYSADGGQSEFSSELVLTNLMDVPPPIVPPVSTQDTVVGVGELTNAVPGTSSPPANLQVTLSGVPPAAGLTREAEGLKLTIWGTVGADMVVESSSNLANAFAWQPITTLLLTNAVPTDGGSPTPPPADALEAAFVPALESYLLAVDTSNPVVFFRLVMPYSHVILADKVLRAKGYQTRLVVVRLAGETLHDVCYVGQDAAYIDCSDATYVLALNHSGATLREIADDFGAYVSMNWTSASEFVYTNGSRQLLSTVVKTDSPDLDPPLTTNQTATVVIDF